MANSTSAKSLRLVFLSTSMGWGGLEMNLLRHARWMAQEGHTVRVLCLDDSPLHRAAMAHIQSDLGQSHALDCRTVRRGVRYLAFATALHRAQRLLRYQADWLWVRDPRDLDTSAMARWVVRLMKGRTKLAFHQGMQIAKTKKSPYHRFRYGAVDAWISPLSWLKTQVNQMTPINADSTHIIPLGLDDRWFDSEGDTIQFRRQCRLELGLSQESFVIGLIGRIDRKKGQAILIRALTEMPPDAHALIVGDPTLDEMSDYFDEVRAIVRENDLQWRVHFRPYMTFPRNAYLASDVVVVCSEQESVGTVTFEAMASHSAIVGTNTGGTAEILEGQRGWTFPATDPSKLAAQLMEIRNNADVIPPRVENGQNYIAQHRRTSVVKRWNALLRGQTESEG